MRFFDRLFRSRSAVTKRNRIMINVGVDLYVDSPENALRGAKTDAIDLRKAFFAHGWKPRQSAVLDYAATARVTSDLIGNTCANLGPDDDLIIQWSGHGVLIPDPVEPDGQVEAICCTDAMIDWPSANHTAREMAGWFREAKEGARIVCIIDTCHSGIRLEDVGLLRSLNPHYRKSRSLVVPASMMGHGPVRGLAAAAQADTAWKRTVLLSGCRSDQTSADTYEDNAYRGAMSSWAFLREFRAAPMDPLWALHARMLDRLKFKGYQQEPQLQGPEALRGIVLG